MYKPNGSKINPLFHTQEAKETQVLQKILQKIYYSYVKQHGTFHKMHSDIVG